MFLERKKVMNRIMCCILASILFLESMPIGVFANEIQENREKVKEKISVKDPGVLKKENLRKKEISKLNSLNTTDTAYPVTGGNIYFDESTGTVTGCDKTVTKAVIPNEIGGIVVTNIGAYAFRECTSLTNITIPSSVTSMEIITFGITCRTDSCPHFAPYRFCPGTTIVAVHLCHQQSTQRNMI